jgi:drug/metabolite transporter (DMT)-like permease
LEKNISLSSWLILILLALTWGSSYILIKKGLVDFSPTQVAGLRVSISALAFLPIFLMRYKTIDWSRWQALMIVGFAGSFFPACLFAVAQTELSSSVTGVLSSLTPLFTLLIGIMFFKASAAWMKILGVLVGLLGAVLLIVLNQEAGDVNNPYFSILVVLATMGYGLSTYVVKTYLQDVGSITISAAAFTIIGIPGLIMLLSSDFVDVLQTSETGWESLGYITILALLGTVAASILFFKLVQITNPVFASMVSYLTPIVAVGWGALDNEVVTIYHFVGMVLILLGVYISRNRGGN